MKVERVRTRGEKHDKYIKVVIDMTFEQYSDFVKLFPHLEVDFGRSDSWVQSMEHRLNLIVECIRTLQHKGGVVTFARLQKYLARRMWAKSKKTLQRDLGRLEERGVIDRDVRTPKKGDGLTGRACIITIRKERQEDEGR